MGNCSLIWSGHIYSAKADRSSYTCTYESDHKQQSATFRSGFFPVEVKILACMQHNGKTHALQSDNNSFLGSIHSWCCALTVHCSCTMSSLQQVFCVFLLLGQLQQLNTIYPYFFTQKKKRQQQKAILISYPGSPTQLLLAREPGHDDVCAGESVDKSI